MYLEVKLSLTDNPVFLSSFLIKTSLLLNLHRSNLMTIGLYFFLFCFGFPTLLMRSMSTFISFYSKCSLMAFKTIMVLTFSCFSGIPWTRRQFLLEYCYWLLKSNFYCSISQLKADISFLKLFINFSFSAISLS